MLYKTRFKAGAATTPMIAWDSHMRKGPRHNGKKLVETDKTSTKAIEVLIELVRCSRERLAMKAVTIPIFSFPPPSFFG
jgi:hypothetical protein